MFVVSEAQRFRNQTGIEMQDLISEGNLGLIEAAKRFDPDRGLRFLTYARWWVRASINEALTRQSRRVRLPQQVVDRIREITAAESQWMTSPSALAAATGLREENVEFLRSIRTGANGVSLDAEIPGTDKITVGEILASAEDVHAEAERTDLQRQIDTCLSCLSKREGFVVRRQFGLREEAMTNEAIGQLMGVSREWVRQIGDQAKQRLIEEHGEILRALL
jgi:RNA polymerase primary sigma factor